MTPLIKSISGIRGIVGETLTPPVVAEYAASFGAWCNGGDVVIGYDGRPSGAALKDAISAALVLHGNNVVDIGMNPTPTVQLMVEKSSAAGGIAVTASHNPSEWNGMKFINARGVFLDAEENAVLFRMVDGGRATYQKWDGIGRSIINHDAADRHINAILSQPLFDIDTIKRRRFSVVVDVVNASGSFIIPELLQSLQCSVIPLACDGSGIFLHLPEPLPSNLGALGEAVRANRADIGFAIDPDADRLVIYDELGEPFGEEYTIVTAIDSALSRSGSQVDRAVVVNLSTTRAVDDIAKRFNAKVIRTPVGEINVVRQMLSSGSVVGGEGSGGVIVPAVHAGRDSLAGIALVLGRLAGTGLSASAYRATLPGYSIFKTKFPLGNLNAPALLEKSVQAFHGERINTDDGVRIDFDDGWVHLRTSNTEPILRLIAEAPTAESAAALAQRIETMIFK